VRGPRAAILKNRINEATDHTSIKLALTPFLYIMISNPCLAKWQCIHEISQVLQPFKLSVARTIWGLGSNLRFTDLPL
jgi:hypothetical protein